MYAEVADVEHLTPSLIRIELGGGDLHQFPGHPATDAYVNARFVPADSPLTVPFTADDVDQLEPHHRPRPRRFTIRRWDPDASRLTIDFVAHGEAGYAGAWAQRAKPGDRLQFEGPGGGYRPSPEVDWHLLVGDESAFGAIGATLEALETGDRAVVVAVVDGPEHEIDMPSMAEVELVWVHRSTAADPEAALPLAVESATFPAGTYDVFVHGEAAEVRAIRRHLLADRGVDAATASISPYWRRQHTDEDWRRVKRQWMAEQAADV